MLPVAAAMPVPATTPMVCATATIPPIRPRRLPGTWSGIIAVTAASIALSAACTPHQPSSITATFGATDSTASEAAPPSAPPTSQGSRRPARSVVRSEKAPASGLQITETSAPAPVTRASTCSLFAASSASACWASSTGSGRRTRPTARRWPAPAAPPSGWAGRRSARRAPPGCCLRPGPSEVRPSAEDDQVVGGVEPVAGGAGGRPLVPAALASTCGPSPRCRRTHGPGRTGRSGWAACTSGCPSCSSP